MDGKTLTQIAVGLGHTCAMDTGGQAYCWGIGGSGELGDGSNTSSNIPVAVTAPPGTTTPSVTVGGVAASNVVVQDDGTITFTAPARPAGVYDLLIDYGNGVSATRANALAYAIAPAPVPTSATAVPTLDQWALALLALLLAGGAALARRRV
jgi:hypothetical protein